MLRSGGMLLIVRRLAATASDVVPSAGRRDEIRWWERLPRRRVDLCCGLLAFASLLAPPLAATPLRISGSTTVNPVVSEAAEALAAASGDAIQIDTLGGSTGGVLCLAEGRCDLAMASRPLSAEDHARFPRVDFQAHTIGWDAVALVVSRDVWEGGIHYLSRDLVQRLYEGKITRWSE
ncbi:MAG: substrate-binding domain-containing protein, partial [Thermoanaerobaculia bacterium]|nr:substrate-binding domain-containing protein [Thermoanaerobaculia bacterium]